MERVTGIGGLFFKAKNPSKLANWYHEHLGIDPVPDSYESTPWTQEAARQFLLRSTRTRNTSEQKTECGW